MKGDFVFKINKKIGLAILGGMSLFAMADFVSLVDAKSSGGIVIEKETMVVGSVVLRIDDMNPADIYGGTWELMTGDASLRFGDGTNLSGSVEGLSNTPTVPLVEHSHDKGTMNISGGFGGSVQGSRGFFTGPNGAFTGANSDSYGSVEHYGYSSTTYKTINFNANRNWTGRTSVEGVNGATLDVRGNYIRVNIWKRVN